MTRYSSDLHRPQVRLFTVTEAAQHIGISATTTRFYVRTGILPGVKQGKPWYVRQDDLEAYRRDHLLNKAAAAARHPHIKGEHTMAPQKPRNGTPWIEADFHTLMEFWPDRWTRFGELVNALQRTPAAVTSRIVSMEAEGITPENFIATIHANPRMMHLHGGVSSGIWKAMIAQRDKERQAALVAEATPVQAALPQAEVQPVPDTQAATDLLRDVLDAIDVLDQKIDRLADQHRAMVERFKTLVLVTDSIKAGYAAINAELGVKP